MPLLPDMPSTATSTRAFRFSGPWPYRIGLGVMLLLLLLSAVCWKERAWLLDVAFQTFLMIKDGTVQVMVYRFGAATVQSIPLLGIKLGLPLAAISWLYSVSFHLHFLAFFLVAGKVFKREDVALGIALLYTAMTYDGFYWQTSELQQGLGALMVSWAALLYFPELSRWWHYPVWGMVCIALAFYHPLVFMPFYLMLIWLWWKPSAGVPRRSLTILGGMMFVVLGVKQLYFQNWYDAQKTAQFIQHLTEDFPNLFSYPAYGKFFQDAFLHWWGYPILLLAVSGWMLAKRRFPALALLWLASAGFLVLNATGDPQSAHRFYAEVNYYPLLAFVLVPVIIDIFPRWQAAGRKLPAWLVPALLVFFTGRLLLIGLHGNEYRNRVGYLRELTAAVPGNEAKKLVVNPADLDQQTLMMDWGLCYESLLQSVTETGRAVTLLPLSDPADKEDALRADSNFVTPWAVFPLGAVNERGYWKLPRSPYGNDGS